MSHKKVPAPGIKPHLIFKIPMFPKSKPGSVAKELDDVGLTVVGIDPDGAVVVFRDEVELNEFKKAVASYTRGPKPGNVTIKWDVFQHLEPSKMRSLEQRDRIGRRLAREIGRNGELADPGVLYVLDIELWHPGQKEFAKQRLNELKTAVKYEAKVGEGVRDEFVGEQLCLARVAVYGSKLIDLLLLDAIDEIEVPPVPVFDAQLAKQVTKRNFPTPPRPPVDGPRVCILDSGVTENHPLLQNNLGHAEAVLTNTSDTSDGVGHGTKVGAIAVFGNVRASYERGVFESSVTLFSARVTNEHNHFDNDRLILNQMRQAIETFKQPPYSCRVFNVSLGQDEAWLESHQKQNEWAESLDVLAREQQVLFVVSAGNHNLAEAHNPADAEQALEGYPTYLLDPKAGLCDPATAAIPITVGGVVEYEALAIRHGRQANDFATAIAGVGQPSPITRIGPGIANAIKPEFIAPAGCPSFEGFGDLRHTRGFEADDGGNRVDPGLGVMSFSHEPTNQLFTYGIGTSYAAPHVARTAALVWDRLKHELGEEPTPNLVRAVLASAATVPAQSRDLIEATFPTDRSALRRICGYGQIDEDFALSSGDRRVALLAQASIAIDSFRIFSIPMPEEFHQAGSDQPQHRVIVALAYDPPVRRRREKYLGIELSMSLIRGKSIDEIIDAYRKLSTEENVAKKDGSQTFEGAFKSPFKCDLEPGVQTLKTSTLQRAEWSFRNCNRKYGDTLRLVVTAKRSWAPAEIMEQNFGVVAVLDGSAPELYARMRTRLKLRERVRI